MATLSTGADAEGGERFGNCEYNNIKNHWRTANPCASLSDLQPGMIVSDENDDRLYVVSLISGCGCSEILQDCVPLSDDKHIGFGYNREGDIGYSSIHCALLMGIPVAALDSGACERGLIIMDEADLAAGADVTGLVPPSAAEPSVFIVDSDLDSYLGVGLQVNDRPGIWTGPDHSIPLALQYEATADVTIFEACGEGENRLVYIYGWDTGAGATRYGTLQVTNSGSFELNAQEAGALAQGGTVVVRWYSDRVQWLDGKLAEFGSTNDASIEYCEATNDAWIFGVPVSPKRGVIWCDKGDIAVDFTGLITASAFVQHHIVDNDNDSELVWGFYANDVGLLTVPANPLREQMLYNADFGVWSLSGLASGTTGAQADYEIGAAIYNEDAEGPDDSGNWIKTDCNMALTNDPGNGCGGSNNYYTITETAATQRITRVLAGLTVGHIYKCSVCINNGTGTWADATLDIMDNALANVIESTALATAVGWAEYSVIFEATEVNNQIAINLALGGGLTAKLDNIRVIEVGPGCYGADDKGPDTWTKTATLDLLRVQNDSTHCRGLYGVKVTKGANGAEYLNAFGRIYDKEAHYKLFRNRTVTLGCWVYSVTAADNVKLELNDSDGTTASAAHCGADALTWMEITRTCGATITSFTPRILFDGDTGDVAYVSQPMLVFGSSIGEGNYRTRQQEWVYCETPVASNLLEGLMNSSDVAWTALNIEADSDAMLPKGAKELKIYTCCRDSASAANDCWVALTPNTATNDYFNAIGGYPNNTYRGHTALLGCDKDGDVNYRINATGANTFDIIYAKYFAVRVN